MTFTFGALLTVIGIQLAAIAGLLVDRARRYRAERALRESEARSTVTRPHGSFS